MLKWGGNRKGGDNGMKRVNANRAVARKNEKKHIL